MFKSLIAYKVVRAVENNDNLRLHVPVIDDILVLQKIVDDNPSTEPSPVGYSRLGFITPPIFGSNSVFNGAMGARLICIQKQERILPSDVINREHAARSAVVAEREGRPLNRQESAQIKDVVVSELLPQAFIKQTSLLVMFHRDWVIVETGSPKVAEDTLRFIRDCLIKEGDDVGSLPLRNMLGEPADVQQAMRTLTLEGQADQSGALFTLGHSIKLYSSEKEAVSFKDTWVNDNSHVRDLILDESHAVTELAILVATDTADMVDVAFTLTKGKVIKAVKWGEHILDRSKPEPAEGEEDDVVKHVVAQFDANIALISGVITTMLAELEWLIIPADKRVKVACDASQASDSLTGAVGVLKGLADKFGGSIELNGNTLYEAEAAHSEQADQNEDDIDHGDYEDDPL